MMDDAAAPTSDPRDHLAEAASLEYAHRLYANVLSWYQSADTKAQVLLALDGVFLGLLAQGFVTEPERLRVALKVMGPATWTCLAAMTACLIGSIACAVLCLVPRTRKGQQNLPEPAKQGPYEADY